MSAVHPSGKRIAHCSVRSAALLGWIEPNVITLLHQYDLRLLLVELRNCL
jgi:hypothetical protein